VGVQYYSLSLVEDAKSRYLMWVSSIIRKAVAIAPTIMGGHVISPFWGSHIITIYFKLRNYWFFKSTYHYILLINHLLQFGGAGEIDRNAPTYTLTLTKNL
jgi:hypothetical protein